MKKEKKSLECTTTHTDSLHTHTTHTPTPHTPTTKMHDREPPLPLKSGEHSAPNECTGQRQKEGKQAALPNHSKTEGHNTRETPTQHMFCVYKHQHTRTQRDSLEKLSSSDRETSVEDMRRQVNKSGPPSKKATIEDEHHTSTPKKKV